MRLNIVIILGSVRIGRHGTAVAHFIKNKCEEKGWRVTVVDPREWKLPLFNKM